MLWSRAEQYDKATGSVRVCVCMSLRVCIPCIPCTVYHTGPFRMHCVLLCRTKGSLRERIPVLQRWSVLHTVVRSVWCHPLSPMVWWYVPCGIILSPLRYGGTFLVVSSSPPYVTVPRSLTDHICCFLWQHVPHWGWCADRAKNCHQNTSCSGQI